MKILLHIRSLNIGGSERQVVSLAKSMANLGAEVHIAVTKSGGQLEHELNGTKNVFLHTITTGNNLVEKFKYLTQLRTLIKSTEFNAVYGFLPTPN